MHLMMFSLKSNVTWEMVQDEVDYHVKSINAIRTTFVGALVIVCRHYTYLREGQGKSWRSSHLVETHLEWLEVSTTQTTESTASAQQIKVTQCRHCTGVLMGADGQMKKCPWHSKSAAKAKEAWKA